MENLVKRLQNEAGLTEDQAYRSLSVIKDFADKEGLKIDWPEFFKGKTENMKEESKDFFDNVSDKAKEWGDKVSDKADDLADDAKRSAHNFSEKVSEKWNS